MILVLMVGPYVFGAFHLFPLVCFHLSRTGISEYDLLFCITFLIFCHLYVNKLCCQSQELNKVCIAVITRGIHAQMNH